MLSIIESDIETDDLIEISSIVLPRRMKLIMNPPVSKYINSPLLGKIPMTKEERLPIDINVSILKFSFFIFFKADT